MKAIRRMLVAVPLLAALGGAAPTPAVAAASDPFLGAWEGVDFFGVHQQLEVSASGASDTRVAGALVHDAYRGCDGASATLTGKGAVGGLTMDIFYRVRCADGTRWPTGTITYTLIPGAETPADDLLVDERDGVWHRA